MRTRSPNTNVDHISKKFYVTDLRVEFCGQYASLSALYNQTLKNPTSCVQCFDWFADMKGIQRCSYPKGFFHYKWKNKIRGTRVCWETGC